MQFTTIFVFTSALLNNVLGDCSTACVNQMKGQIDTQCVGMQASVCQCQSYPSILQCFQNCNDSSSANQVTSVQGWISNVCASASQVASSAAFSGIGMPGQMMPGQMMPGQMMPGQMMGPTPVGNGLFAATTVGSNLILSASGTNVVVPFSGQPTNTNVPVAGNLYSSYNLGSISVGYKSSTMSPFGRTSNTIRTTPVMIGITTLLLATYLF